MDSRFGSGIDSGAPAARAAPLVSIIIPARNEETTIAVSLDALARQTIGRERLEVIVVAAGEDATAEVAARAAAGRFDRFDLIMLADGNKNAALRAGCARARGDVLVLLDADTELDPDAVAEMLAALARDPKSVSHGAMRARIDTVTARFCELQRKMEKEIHFDGLLNGGVIAAPRAALPCDDLPRLLPDSVAANDDAHLGRVLRQRGWRITYAPKAGANTLFPWTFAGLATSMLRNRRGVIAAIPWRDAALQAGNSAVLLASLTAGLLLVPYSPARAALCALPLALHVARFAWRVDALRRRGLGDYRAGLPLYLGLDLVARSLKLWAFAERVAGKRPPATFRGQRPETKLAAQRM